MRLAVSNQDRVLVHARDAFERARVVVCNVARFDARERRRRSALRTRGPVPLQLIDMRLLRLRHARLAVIGGSATCLSATDA